MDEFIAAVDAILPQVLENLRLKEVLQDLMLRLIECSDN